MIDRITLVSLAASACLGAVLPLELRSDITKPDFAAPSAAKSDEPSPPQRDEKLIDQLVATTLARPLFSATRRPAEPEARTPPDNSLNDLRLTGILITPEQHVAIFARSDGKPLVRSEGEMISEWRIDGIAPESVSVSGPTGATTLEPKVDAHLNRVPPTAQLAAPTPPPTPAANPLPAPASRAPLRPSPVRRTER